MEFRKAAKKERTFILDLMEQINQDNSRGIAYPCWDLEGNYHELGINFEDALIIAQENGTDIGVVGVFDSEWGTYLVGPTCVKEYYTEYYVTLLLKELLNSYDLNGKTLESDLKPENEVLVEVLKTFGFTNNYAGVSMHLEKKIQLLPDINVKVLTKADKDSILSVNDIFTKYLKPWTNKNEQHLFNALEDGAHITVILESDIIVGAMVGTETEIEYLAVHGDYQNKGYGRALVDVARTGAEITADEDKIYLDVDVNNQEAQDFYLACGFEVDYHRVVYAKKFD